jgi:hypothetical protein
MFSCKEGKGIITDFGGGREVMKVQAYIKHFKVTFMEHIHNLKI